jgi:hypothetical protein
MYISKKLSPRIRKTLKAQTPRWKMIYTFLATERILKTEEEF